MWDAIEVGAGCTYNLTDTEIRNATRGLALLRDNKSSYIFYPNNCRMERCTLRNNLVGLTLDYSVGTGGNFFLPSVFSGNFFTADNGPLLNGQFPEAAIKFKSCGLAVLPGNNTYERTRTGIKSEGSFVVVYGGTFQHLAFEGVNAKTSTFNVENATFDAVYDMVSSKEGRYLGVRNCTLTHGYHGGVWAHVTDTYRPRVFLNRNNLTFDSVPVYAIKVERSPNADVSAMQNRIDSNLIMVHGNHHFPGKLIDITAPSGGKDRFPITHNDITVDAMLRTTGEVPTCHGIYVTNNASGYEVATNHLNYTSNNKPTNASPNLGISFVNVAMTVQTSTITGNVVNATLFANPVGLDGEGASWIKCGYHIDQSPKLTICDNTGDYTYRLFHFSGSLDYCDFSRNVINHHHYGVLCAAQDNSPQTKMGQQLWHENLWLTTASAYVKRSAKYKDPFATIPPFIFKVHPGVAAENPPNPDPANWFVSINPGAGEHENSKCIGDNFVADDLGGWDSNVIEGTYPYISAAQAWDMQRDLLGKLLERPDYRPAGSASQIWYDNLTSSSAWKYADFERLYYQAYQPTAAAQASLNSAQEKCGVWIREMVRLDSLQNLDVATEDAALRQQQLTTAGQLITASTNLADEQGQAKTITQAALATAQSAWNNLPATQIWESNRKALYEMWLTQAQYKGLGEAEYVRMRGIANQCPQEGGMAVREIPVFLPVPEANLYSKEEYWATCTEVKARQGQSTAPALTDNALTVFPNPAAQQLTLFLAQAAEADWAITDLTGRTWQRGRLMDGQTSVTFDTQPLPTGLYLCTVRTSSGLALTAKIAIQH